MKFERKFPVAIDATAADVDWNFSEPPQQTAEGFGNEIAYMTIRGPITHHGEWWGFECYDAIIARAREAFASEAKIVFISGDTPGGDVSGCFDTSRELRKMADETGKLLVWYVDGQTCSAGLALAMAADYIVVPEEGRFGSIGVIAELQSCKRQADAMGVDVELVTSGERKADGHPMNEISKGTRGAVQSSVDYESNVFFSWVSERRQIPIETIKGWQAGIFHGQEAVDVGLADEVGGESAALAMCAGVELETAPQGAESDDIMKPKTLAASARATLGLPSSQAVASSAEDFEGIRKRLGKMAGEDSDEGRKARKALDAMDENAEGEDDEDKPDHKEPDGDEGSDEGGESASISAAESKDDEDGDGEDDEAASSAESEDDAKKCEDDAKKAEAEAADEDAKAMAAISGTAKDAAKVAKGHMVRARSLRAAATRLRREAKSYRRISAQNAVILEQAKAIDTLTKRVAKLGAPNPSVAAIGAKGTRGREQTNGSNAGTGNTASGVEDVDLSIFSERELKALRLGTKSTGLVDVGNGKMELGLLSPEQANAIVAATEKRVAQLRGGE